MRQGAPPIDELMQEWVYGVLSCDQAASNRLRIAIEYSLAQVAKADAAAYLSRPESDARSIYAERAEILQAIERALRDG